MTPDTKPEPVALANALRLSLTEPREGMELTAEDVSVNRDLAQAIYDLLTEPVAQEAVDLKALLREWYVRGPSASTNWDLVAHGHVDDGLLLDLMETVRSALYAFPAPSRVAELEKHAEAMANAARNYRVIGEGPVPFVQFTTIGMDDMTAAIKAYEQWKESGR